jgi:hypothetical protein
LARNVRNGKRYFFERIKDALSSLIAACVKGYTVRAWKALPVAVRRAFLQPEPVPRKDLSYVIDLIENRSSDDRPDAGAYRELLLLLEDDAVWSTLGDACAIDIVELLLLDLSAGAPRPGSNPPPPAPGDSRALAPRLSILYRYFLDRRGRIRGYYIPVTGFVPV